MGTQRATAALMPFDLSRLSLSDMTECGATLRRLGDGASSMEAAATEVVSYLRQALVTRDDAPACPLVRLYKTHALEKLPASLQEFARGAGGQELDGGTRCLTLLATAGGLPEWNDRRMSRGHQAIPLPSPEAMRQLPMVLQLVRQLGLDPGQVVAPDADLMMDAAQRTFNVFYVPQAEGSPYIPAQEFVREHRIASVIGFGGLLPPAELFAVILFSEVPIGHEAAELFKPLSLSAKMPILRFAGGRVFDDA